MNIEPAVRGTTAGKAVRRNADRVGRPLLYDLPELRGAHDALWTALRERAPALRTAPARLSRDTDGDWGEVVFGQVSGYRYATQLVDHVTLIATPRYKAKGADGPFVRSAILVRAKDPVGGLVDLRGRSLALQAGDLNSINLLRAEAAQLALGGRFFGPVHPHDTLDGVAEAVLEGRTDAALLDCVALALLGRLRPDLTRGLRVLLWTTRSPGPPIIAGLSLKPSAVEAVRQALNDIAADASLEQVRNDLLIAGFNLLPKAQYRAITHLEQIAESQDYPRLA